MSKNRPRGTRGGKGRSKNGYSNRRGGVQNSAMTAMTIEADEYLQWMLALSMSRFDWSGLPETCDARYLEWCLTNYGIACIAHDPETPDVWLSLRVAAETDYNYYRDPVQWRAMGENGRADFEVRAGVNGFLIRDRASRVCMWPKMARLANKLARYSRTEDNNLMQMYSMFIAAAPEEKVIDVQNALASLLEGQPAVIGYDGLLDTVNNGLQVFQTGVEWIGDKLQSGSMGVWSEFFRIQGIPHQPFEKKERMITGEMHGTHGETRLMLDDALRGREIGVEAGRAFGLDLGVKINDVLEEAYSMAPIDGEVDGNE